jgi:predicted transcriptional regulator
MEKDRITDVLERARRWPQDAQDELAGIALEIEAELQDGDYHATPEELRGIDRGLSDMAQGRYATDEEVDAVLARHRRS